MARTADRSEAHIRALLELPSALAVDRDDTGRVLIRHDKTGTYQLYELSSAASRGSARPNPLRPLTHLPETVDGMYVPTTREAVIAVDAGGNERTQLYLIDLEDVPVLDLTQARALAVDARFAHHLAGISPDGKLVAFLSNRRNGIDFDVWIAELSTGEQRCLYDKGGWCHPSSGFSPDGRWLSIGRPGLRPLDTDLLLIDVASGASRIIDSHSDEPAVVGPPAWLDATTFVSASSVGLDHAALIRFDLSSGSRQALVDGPWDHAAWASRDGSTILAVTNEDGCTTAAFIDARTAEPQESLPLPEAGIIAMEHGFPVPLLSPDGGSVTYTFSSPVRPASVWHFDRSTGITRALTAAPAVGPETLVTPTRHRVTSFDGEELSAAVYRPRGTASTTLPPVVLAIHGGPERQSMLTFSPLIQALVAAGLAVVAPNVRGSTGYGKRFASLDDATRRLDSVADLAAIHDWLPTIGLNRARAGLCGASYGGYMVLAGCAFQPQRWAVGIVEVGISDLTTFLENTAPYRRPQRQLEYGSLERDRAFLRYASPLAHAADITAPLLLIHGLNDPRVPISEAEQLVASTVCSTLLVYTDEGHGLSRLANKLDAYPRAVQFVVEALGCAP